MPWSIQKKDGQFCVLKSGTDEVEGCHNTRADAVAQIRALYSGEADGAAINYNVGDVEEVTEWLQRALESGDPDALTYAVKEALAAFGEGDGEDETLEEFGYEHDGDEQPKLKEFAWEGPIIFEGVTTGDNRYFRDGSIQWDEDTLPWAFRWQRSSVKGHQGAVPIGRLDKIERRPGGVIYGFGVIIPDLNDEAAEYMRMMEAGVVSGVSVDGDSAEFDIMESLTGEPRIEFSTMRLRSLTAVDIPAFHAARIGLSITDDELAARREKKQAIYHRLTAAANEKRHVEPFVLTAAAIPVKPRIEWFQDPSFDGPTPITVTKEGNVSGHLALFDTCHIGFPGTCVTPPRGATYKYFHTGEVETAEGDCVEVGHLTFNTGHAEMSDSPKAAVAHYDHTGTVAADVRAGEDKHGVWVTGALRSTLADEDIRAFRAAPLSGDWRRIAGKLELVGALAVNVPGFPVPRARALVASGSTETLITFQDSEERDMKTRLDQRAQLAARLEEFYNPNHSPEDGKFSPGSGGGSGGGGAGKDDDSPKESSPEAESTKT